MKFLNLLEKLSKVEEAHLLETPTSRRAAFGQMGNAALNVAKVAVPFGIAAMMPGRSWAQTGGNSVIDVLNFALTLEYLESEYYNTGLSMTGLLSGDTRLVIELIAKHENAHVALLRGAITGAGGTPVNKPNFDFTAGGTFADVMSNPATFLAVAQAFEDTGVRAYKGQAGNLLGTDTLTVALQIHAVEARHAAMIRRMRSLEGWIPFANGIPGVPAAAAVYEGEENITQLGLNAVTVSGGVSAERVTEAYDEPLSKAKVLDIAGLFIV